MELQIISQSPRGAQVVLKGNGESTTIHLERDERGRYLDKWRQVYDLNQPEPSPRFLAEWYGVRAAVAIRQRRDADALVRTALRYAFLALPQPAEAAA